MSIDLTALTATALKDDTKVLKSRSRASYKLVKKQLEQRNMARDSFNAILKSEDSLLKATLLEAAGQKLIHETKQFLEATKIAVAAYVEEAKLLGAIREQERKAPQQEKD